MKSIIPIMLLVMILSGCKEASNPEDSLALKPGLWTMEMEIENTIIPLRIEIDSLQNITIINSSERILISDVVINGDSIDFIMSRYESGFHGIIENDQSISGLWQNYSKEDYFIPFKAQYSSNQISPDYSSSSAKSYEVTFSPNSDDAYPAIGLFDQKGEHLTGTFITETGDYRFLEGSVIDEQLTLSCFDGAHMFLFQGKMQGDSIVDGVFNSGKHWSEPWHAALNPNIALTHPDSLTYLLPEFESVDFDVMTLDGDIVHFGNEQYLGRVSIIQIFGSWCPNCWDENVFYKSLYDDYVTEGFQVIPVAFEATDDFDKNVAAVRRQFEEIGIVYPAYLGGKRNKASTSKKFHMLNKIISYPTSIFIDKNGVVRKVHTGFYGPGTGRYYDEYVKSTREFVELLLKE